MASRSDTELLTEHFGYPPISLLDQIINTLNALAERALSSIESGLLNAPPAALGFRPPPPPKYAAAAAAQSQQPPPSYDAATAHRQEVESGVHALETLLFASIDRDFDLFEIVVMRNVLTVSQENLDWVTLKHYAGLTFDDHDDEDDDDQVHHDKNANGASGKNGSRAVAAAEGVNALRRRLQASLRLKTMLEAERARNQGLLKEMRRLVGRRSTGQHNLVKREDLDGNSNSNSNNNNNNNEHQGRRRRQGGKEKENQGAEKEGEEEEEEEEGGKAFGFLLGDLGLQGDKDTPISTTAAFGISQLDGLRQLSKELREVMKALCGDGGGGGDTKQDEEDNDEQEGEDEKSWRRERLQYIEGATRKHLENVRGLELGEHGEVRNEDDSEGLPLLVAGGGGSGDKGKKKLAGGIKEVESLEKVVGLLGVADTPPKEGGGGQGDDDGDAMDES